MNWSIISNELEHKRALLRLEAIFDSKPGDKTYKEAELLAMLIENYETEKEPIFPDPDPIEVIKDKMEQRNMSNKDFAEIVGSKSKASEILNKKRALTLKMIRQINKTLGIPADVLISEYDLAS